MSFLYSLVGFLLAIGVLVAVHEFGHYWVARKLGVKVLRFSVGFGRPLWKKVAGSDQTEYVLAAIPLGGYVKMLGENDPDVVVAPQDAHRTFDSQPIWKRSLIVVAGPAINFLFAFFLFALLALPAEQSLKPVLGPVPAESKLAAHGVNAGDLLLSVNGRKVDYFSQYDLYLFNEVLKGNPVTLEVAPSITTKDEPFSTSASNIRTLEQEQFGVPRELNLRVDDIPIYNINPASLVRTLGLTPQLPEITNELAQVVAGSAADRAGLQQGDKVFAIDDVPISAWSDLVTMVAAAPDQPLRLLIERGDLTLQITATPESIDNGAGGQVGRLGVAPLVLPHTAEQRTTVNRSLFGALNHGAEQTWLMSVVTLRMLWKMVTLQVSHKNISGPITIADFTGQAIQIGWETYLFILAVISISLGVMNLLPIPMLDGGRLLMYSVEAVAGQRAAQRAFAVGQRLGVVMLLCLMSLAFYNDIFRLLN